MINNCAINRTKPAFSANIMFVKTPCLDRCMKRNVEVSGFKWEKGFLTKAPFYTIDEAQNSLKLGTQEVFDCVAGGITGGNSNYNLLFHIFPDNFMKDLANNIKKLNFKFAATSNMLKLEGKKPEGFIMGGNYFWEESKELTVVLKHFFEKFGLEPTVFGGSKKEKAIYYNGKSNMWLAWMPGLHTKKNVCDVFDFIRLGPNDKVKFSDNSWINGSKDSLTKGDLVTSMDNLLKKYGVDPKVLNEFQP